MRRAVKKLRAQLAHCGDLDGRYMKSIPGPTNTPKAIASLLKSAGAPDKCYLVSEDESIDGITVNLEDTIAKVCGQGMGTIVSCIAGRLAYYEGEYSSESCILQRID